MRAVHRVGLGDEVEQRLVVDRDDLVDAPVVPGLLMGGGGAPRCGIEHGVPGLRSPLA